MTRLAQSVAMGVGVAGAMVDVSDYADLQAGVSRTWGRQSEFDDAAPGTFSFTLNNADGRFTPGNTSSPLDTTVTEGMQVCWELDSRLVAGTVQAIEPTFPSAESAWAQVRITCDDMLGNAGRRQLSDLSDSLFDIASGWLLYPLDEAASPPSIQQSRGSQVGSASYWNPLITFGSTASQIIVENTVAEVPADLSQPNFYFDYTTFDYPLTTCGGWGFWVERKAGSVVSLQVKGIVLDQNVTLTASSTETTLTPGGSGTPITTGPLSEGVAHYLSFSSVTSFSSVWTITYTFYIDGVSIGSSNYSRGTTIMSLTASQRRQRLILGNGFGGGSTGSFYISRISHTPFALNEYDAGAVSAAARLGGIAAAAPEIVLDTLPAMADAILGPANTNEKSALDAFNEVIRGEQGSIYSSTTGTLTSPVEKISVRSRDRTTTAAYTFDVSDEASGATDFVRDVTNMVSTVEAVGPSTSVLYTDSALTDRVGSANTSENVPFRDALDLYTWATDRVWRGANVGLRAGSLKIDVLTTPTDRSADLLALVPGDRIEITGLPSDQLGFTTWDGWLLGATETHNLTEHSFTLFLAPVLPDTAIFDTDSFTADGALTLSSAISTTGATSMSVATSGPKLETSAVPYDLMVDAERVTVTACTGATPQVATITRGVGGTTAATHTTAAVIEIPDDALFAF